ncbi:MAG: Uma2 family endonuclease [Polyangiales bacterium]
MNRPATPLPPAPAGYRDVLAAPAGQLAQVIDGVLDLQPRPALQHVNTASSLGALLLPAFRFGDGGPGAPGGWLILDEPELHFGDTRSDDSVRDIVVPDLAGWRRERLPDACQHAAFLTVAPDWVCEILSPSTQGIDRVQKMAVYLREGVRHVWLIEPQAQVLEVFEARAGAWVRVLSAEGGDSVRAVPFDAVELALGRVFAW